MASFLEIDLERFGITPKFKHSNYPNTFEQKLPVKSGRQSEPEGVQTIGSVMKELMMVDASFRFEVIGVLKHLAMYNADFGFAVENVVTLGNTEYEIVFDDNVSDDQKKKMLISIRDYKADWYGYSDGLNSLINDLFAQVAITGAVSSEIIPDTSLKNIKKVVLVNTETIRFLYNDSNDEYEPYQQSREKVLNHLIKLNPITYRYYSLRRFDEKPYGIPPFLTALESTVIERNMVDNLKKITNKLGALGFLQVLINAPTKKTSETDQQYWDRCQDYLTRVTPEMEKSLSKGYVAGFKGTHEFEMVSTTTNVRGARELFQMNTEMKMAGLKQDPMMLGRNWSTTETLGRVVLTKLASQVENYQKTVGAFLSHLFKLHLLLQGFKFDYLGVEFEQPTLGDRVKEEEAFGKKIDNADKLFDNGVIGQEERAKILGYEEADEKEPRNTYKSNGATPSVNSPDDGSGKSTDPSNNTSSNWRDIPWIKDLE